MVFDLFACVPVFSEFRQLDRKTRQLLQNPEKRSALVRNIVERARSSLELRVVLQTVIDEVASLLNLDRCSFLWYFQDTRRLQLVCEWQRQPLAQKSLGQKIEGKPPIYYSPDLFGAAAEAISQGEMIVSSGTYPGPLWLRPLVRWLFRLRNLEIRRDFRHFGAKSAVLMPIRSQQSPGFLACFTAHPRAWSAAEIEFLQLMAQQVEIAISQAQLYEQTQKQAQRERLVNQITNQTRQSFELEIILSEAIAQLLDALQIDRCLVHLVGEAGQAPLGGLVGDRTLETSNGRVALRRQHLLEVCREPFLPSIDDFDPHGPITQWVIQKRQRVIISDVTEDERIGPDNLEYQRAHIQSSLVVPVQVKGTIHAILYLNQCAHVRYWSPNDQKLAQAVADQLAISIQQAYLYAQTQQQAAESAAQARYLAETLQELRLTQSHLIQSEKMSSLGRMVAGVAHEINNPVNFIYGNIPYIETYIRDLLLLLEGYQTHFPDTPEELRQLADEIELNFIVEDIPRILSSIRVGADRIRQIVKSLRNFSRLDESKRKAVDIHAGLDSTLLMLQSHIKVDIQIVRDYGKLPLVECFASQLNQAFMNILLNAVEALSRWPGQPKTIAVCTDLVTVPQGEWVRIVIADNGPGILHEIQPKVFDPFFTTKDVGQGIGLGLTVSYQTIVNQHQGSLKFYSEPGLGAEFLIEIPVRPLRSKSLKQTATAPETLLPSRERPLTDYPSLGNAMEGQLGIQKALTIGQGN